MLLLIVAGLAAAAPDPDACAEAGEGAFMAATANAASLGQLVWSPFGRAELGWRIYAPKIAREIGTRCAPASPGFARALQGWQVRHRLPATGAVDAASFAAMKGGWQAARPFAHIDGKHSCPPPPPPERLATADAAEGYGGKRVALRTTALAAYRTLVASAVRDGVRRSEPRALKLFSGFRDPASDAARCTAEGNCNGIVRATCSAHRTGLAIDLWVGQAPGFGPDSTSDANRLAMVQTPAYRWMLANAAHFGFINYVFEPWHWEWTGEPV